MMRWLRTLRRHERGAAVIEMAFALPALIIMLLPFGILAVLLKVLPPWEHKDKADGLAQNA